MSVVLDFFASNCPLRASPKDYMPFMFEGKVRLVQRLDVLNHTRKVAQVQTRVNKARTDGPNLPRADALALTAWHMATLDTLLS